MRGKLIVGLVTSLLVLRSLHGAALIAVEPVPVPIESYAEAVAAARTFYDEEVRFAQGEGKVHATPFRALSEEAFRRIRDADALEVLRITYLSDGLQVKGFVWKPKVTAAARRLPVIVFNRGGSREFGKLRAWGSVPLEYARAGFVVIGSQYRGADGGEGREEFGGADVNDILNLQPVIESLEYADPSALFMLGWSRGGMMTYLALRRGFPARAAAIGGPLVDLVDEARRRPQVAERVWSQLIPGFADHRDAVLRERSPIYWAHEISTPMLILHGGADWRADPANSLELARRLQTAGRPYELHLYAGDDHGLSLHREEGIRNVVRWFRSHLPSSANEPRTDR